MRLPSPSIGLQARTNTRRFEFLDQAITAFLSGSYHVRNAAMTAIRRFMQQNEENSFQVCRRVEGMDNSSSDVEQLLYNLVKEEVC